jgi:hypothetical protein
MGTQISANVIAMGAALMTYDRVFAKLNNFDGKVNCVSDLLLGQHGEVNSQVSDSGPGSTPSPTHIY